MNALEPFYIAVTDFLTDFLTGVRFFDRKVDRLSDR